MKYKLRQMLIDDLSRVCDLYKDANQFTSKNNIKKWTKSDLKKYPKFHLVLEIGNTIIGSISATLHSNNLAVIEDIAVDRKFRGRKVGDKLMKNLLSILKADKISKVRLWVHWTDARAIPFYYRHGFRTKMFRHTHGIKDVPDNEDIFILERMI